MEPVDDTFVSAALLNVERLFFGDQRSGGFPMAVETGDIVDARSGAIRAHFKRLERRRRNLLGRGLTWKAIAPKTKAAESKS